MKTVILAIVLAISGSIGFAGVASAQAGPPSDAQGYWDWIRDHSRPEAPNVCCPRGTASAPSNPCDLSPSPGRSASIFCVVEFRAGLRAH